MTRRQSLVALAELLDTKISKFKLDLYLDAVKDLSDDEFKAGYNELVLNFSYGRFPTPAEFRSAARPRLTPRQESIQILDRVKIAVRRFGWPQPELAKEFLGDMAWSFVERNGGWEHVCSDPNANVNDSTRYAQMRDACEAHVSAIRSGIDYDALPGSSSPRFNLLKGGVGILKSIDESIDNGNGDSQ